MVALSVFREKQTVQRKPHYLQYFANQKTFKGSIVPVQKKSTTQILTAEQIRQNVKIIKDALGRLGVDIKHGHALETASAVAGYRDWNTASATAPKHAPESHNCPVSFFDTHSVTF